MKQTGPKLRMPISHKMTDICIKGINLAIVDLLSVLTELPMGSMNEKLEVELFHKPI